MTRSSDAITSGKRSRKTRSASVKSYTGIVTSVGTETFLLLHAMRGDNIMVVSTYSVGLKAQKPLPSTGGGHNEDRRLYAGLHRYPGRDPSASGDSGVCSHGTDGGGRLS